MDEKKQDDTSGIMPEAVPETVETTMTGVPVTETVEVPMGTSEAAPTKFNFKAYGAMVVGILVIAAGLLFVLEKEGRTSTGVFSGIISSMEEGKPVARVNDVEILMSDFTSSYDQLLEMSSSQGIDVSDPALLEQLRTQAVDTLVNAEVLRQAAIAAGMTATENEFLIQGLFDANIDSANLTATEEELTALYDQAGGVEAGLPPMAEIKDQIEAQIIFDKEQKLISAFIESLRAEATIEVLI